MFNVNDYTQDQLAAMEFRAKGIHPTAKLLNEAKEQIDLELTTAEAVDYVIAAHSDDMTPLSIALSRTEMVDTMIVDDINSIQLSVSQGDTKFLDTVLRGNCGWIQYSELSDIEVANEYDNRNDEGLLDELYEEIREDKLLQIAFAQESDNPSSMRR